MAAPRTLIPIALVVAVLGVVVLVVAGSGDDGAHRLSVTVPDATNAVAGQSVRAGGSEVGRITSVDAADGGRKVRLKMKLTDKAWPLPQGSTLKLRWGGTVSFNNRYVALTLGPSDNPPIREGAELPPGDFSVPVEVDTLLSAFNPRVRTDIKQFVDNAGQALKNARSGFTRALDEAPPALDETRHVVSDLAANQQALDTLLRQADTSVQAVQSADPGLHRIIGGAAQTFAAVASRQHELKQTLDTTPVTLIRARHTLRHVDGTLTSAAELTDRLSPGVTQLRRIASPLNRVLGTVVDVGPDARSTLASLHDATPSLNPTLTKLTGQMPTLENIGRQGAEQVKCIRPYSPELMALFSDWAAFQSGSDGRDKFFRANVILPAAAPLNTLPNQYDSETAKKIFGSGLAYGNPLPPGAIAGQPWFQPQCNIGADNLNPARDPESRK